MVQDLNTIHVSDALAWDHCSRHAWFVLRNSAVEDVETDRFEKLIKTLGDEHEAEVLTRFDIFRTAKSVAHTQELVEAQVPVIYQPKFFDAELNLAGVPDFLLLEGKKSLGIKFNNFFYFFNIFFRNFFCLFGTIR